MLNQKNLYLVGQVRIGEDKEHDILLNVYYRTYGRRALTDVTSDKIYYSDDPIKVDVVDYDYIVVKRNTVEEAYDSHFTSIQSSVHMFLEKVYDNDLDFLEKCIDEGYNL